MGGWAPQVAWSGVCRHAPMPENLMLWHLTPAPRWGLQLFSRPPCSLGLFPCWLPGDRSLRRAGSTLWFSVYQADLVRGPLLQAWTPAGGCVGRMAVTGLGKRVEAVCPAALGAAVRALRVLKWAGGQEPHAPLLPLVPGDLPSQWLAILRPLSGVGWPCRPAGLLLGSHRASSS